MRGTGPPVAAPDDVDSIIWQNHSRLFGVKRGLRTLSARILIGFTILILTFGGTTIYLFWFMTQVGQEVSIIRDGYLPLAQKTRQLHDVQEELTLYFRDAKDEPLTRMNLRLKSRRANRSRNLDEIDAILAKLTVPDRHARFVSDTTAKVRDLRARADSLEPSYQALSAVPQQDRAAAAPLLDKLQIDEGKIKNVASGLAREQEAMVHKTTRVIDHNEERMRLFTILVGVAAIVVGLLVTVWVTLALKPLRRLRDAARRIAAGDYASRIAERGPSEVADLAREFNVMGRAVEEREREIVRSERFAAIGKMAAMVTHEVRNPLSSIALNTELLEDELRSRESKEALDLCRAITNEVDRLTELTEQYLAFARLPRPNLVADQVNDVVGAVAAFVREDLAKRGVALTVELAADLPRALVDPAQLRQCLLNLVRNATEAVVGRDVPAVALVTRRADGRVEIDVSDNGPGIADEVADRVFEPFVTTKQGGTGLGLALTNQIIRDHGGAVRVVSKPGVGAIFTVELPLAPVAAAPKPQDEVANATGTGRPSIVGHGGT
jgi:signal transduction histidine kinase